MTEIVNQLRNKDFRFVKLGKEGTEKGKIPFEKDWTNKEYKFFSAELKNHIKGGNNFGIIGGRGDLVIVDIDEKELGEELSKKLDTFAVKTGSGGRHFYFIVEGKVDNCVLINELGEVRANNYQVVAPTCKHPNGNYYEVVNDVEIKKVEAKFIQELIKPYVRKETATATTSNNAEPTEKDTSGSGLEYRRVLALIRNGKTKEEIYEELMKYSKWKSAGDSYRDTTYNNALVYAQSEDKAKSFLREDRIKYASLGCGCHNGVYYFGTKLFRDGKSYDAIVTSNKNIYVNTSVKTKEGWTGINEIKLKFGLKYKEDFFDESLDYILSREAITKWIYGDSNDIDIPSIYEDLVKLFKKYIYLEDERKYSLLACYRIASFFMSIWKTRARLFLWAEMGSAKSRLTQILHNTGFNSIALGDWTLPYIKSIIESTRGETHIDDFETLDEEKKKSTERQIKVGFMKGFKAGKMSDGKRKPEVNDLFNTTTINNTEGLDFISADRCITIRIPKISKPNYDIEPNFEEPIYKELRDRLYILGLKYAEQVEVIYKDIKTDKIRGRLFSIIKPELTIAKLISKEVYEDIEDFWVEEIEQRITIDYEDDWEFLAYKEMFKKLLSPNTTNTTLSTLSTLSPHTFYLKDITNSIMEELYKDLEESQSKKRRRGIGIFLGNIFSRNPIFKKGATGGRTRYEIKPAELINLLNAKKFLSPIKQILNIK